MVQCTKYLKDVITRVKEVARGGTGWPKKTRAKKWGGGAVEPLSGGRGAGSTSNTMGPRPTSIPSGIPNLSNRLATIHQCHRQDRQRSDTIKGTVLQTVVQKLINASIAYGLVNTIVHKRTPSVYSWCEGSLPVIISMQKQLSRYNQKYQITVKAHSLPKNVTTFVSL